MKLSTYFGIEYATFFPILGTVGEVFHIPIPTDYKGSDFEDRPGHFATLLLKICIREIERVGITDIIIPQEDMDAWHTAARKGGNFRPLRVIKPVGGVLECAPDHIRAVYSTQEVDRVRLDRGVEIPFVGIFKAMFMSANLILKSTGPIRFGNGVRAEGPYPSTFVKGAPGHSDEVFDTVWNLITVERNSFIKRYKAYAAKFSPPDASPKEEAAEQALPNDKRAWELSGSCLNEFLKDFGKMSGIETESPPAEDNDVGDNRAETEEEIPILIPLTGPHEAPREDPDEGIEGISFLQKSDVSEQDVDIESMLRESQSVTPSNNL